MKKALQILNSVVENRYFFWAMVLVALLFVTFFSISTSPLYVDEGKDSVIFKSMGLAITQGKIPYADFFDHKGPVLYFINALGQWLLQGRWGIFFLQLIAASISFIYLFKTTRLFLNGIQSIIVMALALFILGGFYEEGNLSEEWMLAIMMPCIYCLLSDIVHKDLSHITPWYGLLYGICFGLTFFIRPTDTLAILGGMLLGAICYACVILKMDQLKTLYDVLAFVAGFILVSIPICAYFAYNHAWSDFIYGSFIHNSLYSGGVQGLLLSYKKLTLFAVWVVLWYLIKTSPYKNLLFVVIPVCCFQFVVIGSRMYHHYLTDYIFLFLLVLIFLMKRSNVTSLAGYSLLLYLILLVGRINVFRFAEDALLERIELLLTHDEKNRVFYAESENLLNVVPQEMQDSIWNYNVTWRGKDPSYSSIFFHHGITQCNKVPHYTMCYVSEKLKKDDNIQQYAPAYVVLTHSHDDDTIRQPSWAEFADDYQYIYANYELIAKTDSTICDIELFKRKLVEE